MSDPSLPPADEAPSASVATNRSSRHHPARWVLVGLGSVAQIVGTAIVVREGPPPEGATEVGRLLMLGLSLTVAGFISLVIGLVSVAKSKGRSPLWAGLAILTLSKFSWIGLLIVLAVFTRLKDRSVTSGPPADADTSPEERPPPQGS